MFTLGNNRVHSDAGLTSNEGKQDAVRTRNVGNQFGSEAKEFTLGRKPYPEALYSFIKDFLTTDKEILDLGCGNGRSTNGLFEAGYRNITGYDLDPQMLEEAKTNSPKSGYQISYIQGDVKELTKKMPLHYRVDAVTAFNSIHWFSHPDSFNEIKNILRPDGVFIVVRGGGGNDEIMLKCREILSRALNYEVPSGRGDKYDAILDLEENNFEIIKEDKFAVEDEYTFEEALAKMKSHSFWIESDNRKYDVLPEIEVMIKNHLQDNVVRIPAIYRCIIAKPKN